MMSFKNIFLIFSCCIIECTLYAHNFTRSKKIYEKLNQDPQNSFVLSFGTSISQSSITNNTCHPEALQTQLYYCAQQQKNPALWLQNNDRIWYTLSCLPIIHCAQCQTIIDPATLNLDTNSMYIQNLIKDIAQPNQYKKLTITKCPKCDESITTQTKQYQNFSSAKQDALVEQIKYIKVDQQIGCARNKLPNYRISIELCDILDDGTDQINPKKLADLSAWLKKIGNPLVFMHHYANPQAIPNLFEQEEHIEWFANCCAQIIAHNPHITHICPISQPTAFSFRTTKKNLPPFIYTISQEKLLNNMARAHALAYDKIKAINPHVQVLACHQWKPMIPMHSMLDPRYGIEKIVCTIASQIYNLAFVNTFKPYENKIDGLAISVYPPLKFNLWTPCGNNCNGELDAVNSLECITAIYNYFPNKKIIIAESGCNNPNSEKQKQYVDMMLMLCKKARDLHIPVIGLFLWCHADNYYMEWNMPQGSTHFGLFNCMSSNNIEQSIKPLGLYVQQIIQNNS